MVLSYSVNAHSFFVLFQRRSGDQKKKKKTCGRVPETSSLRAGAAALAYRNGTSVQLLIAASRQAFYAHHDAHDVMCVLS
jgi:hypothetical protein